MIKGTSYTIAYTAYDTTSGAPKTGDSSHHTAYISYNGSAFSTISNAKTERGYGVYTITLTTSQTNYDMVVLQVVSSTANVYCPPVQLSFDASPLTADNVWSYSSRSVTSVPSTVATATELAKVVNRVPSSGTLSTLTTSNIPTAAAIAASVWSTTSRVVTSVTDPVYLSTTDITTIRDGLATATNLATVDSNVDIIVSKLPTSGTISSLTSSNLSNLATASAVATIDANVDTIVAKLPTSGTISSLTTANLSDIPASVWSNTTRTLTASSATGGATAQEIWEYADRTLTSESIDLSSLATASSIASLQATVSTLPTSSAITTDVWAYATRTLTSGGGSSSGDGGDGGSGTSVDVSCIMNYLLNKPEILE